VQLWIGGAALPSDVPCHIKLSGRNKVCTVHVWTSPRGKSFPSSVYRTLDTLPLLSTFSTLSTLSSVRRPLLLAARYVYQVTVNHAFASYRQFYEELCRRIHQEQTDNYCYGDLRQAGDKLHTDFNFIVQSVYETEFELC
jgi:hypothetical protein